jgi:hypothetical protein
MAKIGKCSNRVKCILAYTGQDIEFEGEAICPQCGEVLTEIESKDKDKNIKRWWLILIPVVLVAAFFVVQHFLSDGSKVSGNITPEPSPTSQPSLTPEPSPTPQPSQTPEPSLAPQPSQTPEPSLAPQPSQTLEPSPTPQPSQTPEPSLAPQPSQTLEPSPTPQPSQTPEPSLAPRASIVPTASGQNMVWPDGRTLSHPEHVVQARVTNVESGDDLKMRSGPGTAFEVVVGIPGDQTVSAYDQDQVWDGDTWWVPVEWKSWRGYVGRSFLPK